MFTLTSTDAVFENFNVRDEKHGDEHVGAVDLRFTISQSNDVLDELETGLKVALYKKAEGADSDMLTPGHLPKIRFGYLGDLQWGLEMAGARITIKRGISGASDIEISDCKVNKFSIACMDGGTCSITFRVQAHPEPEQVAQLYTIQQQTVVLSVIPPTVQQEAKKPKRKKGEPDAQVPLELEKGEAKPVSAPEGGWPFGTKDEKPDADAIKTMEAGGHHVAGALKALAAAGYSVTTGEIERWTKAEVAEAIAYAEKLHNLKGKSEPPKAPDILRGRPRHNRPTSVTRH